jgi:D-beta-D-heptose 7-phosphate kinase/D-beta-D-heptose 1-phosphate adenosyltransferase
MKILVIGETCRDRFVYGNATRLCPEAPVPVFVEENIISAIGMAGNVKRNILACADDLGKQVSVDIITNHKSGFKTRYIDSVSNQMFLRVDSDTYHSLDTDKLLDIDFDNYDAVIVSDYNKGFLSCQDLIYIARKAKLSFLDTKRKYKSIWADLFDFVKINEKEYRENGFEENYDLCRSNTIVTLGSKGCMFKDDIFKPERSCQVRDVSGAGDTFIAAFALYYLMTGEVDLSIAYAQRCCSIVIGKAGTATI